MKEYFTFLFRLFRLAFRGSKTYYAWMTLLTLGVLSGAWAYAQQLEYGLAVTGMTDSVSWGAYIANFTFWVGTAAAAVMLVIPAYIYKIKEIKDIVVIGELVAVASIVVCLSFVTVDLGRPDRFWHLMPFIGKFNFPISMLSWDVIALSGYLALNLHIPGYLLWKKYKGEEPTKTFYIPFVFMSIVWAISIHTVTAFLYVGLGGRPFWNGAIVAPRFLASAFTAGPAFIILALQIIRKNTDFKVSDVAINKLAEIVTVAMMVNLFLLLAELFKEFYSGTLHSASAIYLFFGLHGKHALVPWIWTALGLNIFAATILLKKKWRTNFLTLNLACIAAFNGIWIEKGMGLIVPGFIPTPLGDIVEYSPSFIENTVCVGIWALGFLVFSFLVKVSLPVETGEYTMATIKAHSVKE